MALCSLLLSRELARHHMDRGHDLGGDSLLMVTTFLGAPLCAQQGQKDALGEAEGSSGWQLLCSLLGVPG